MIKYSLILLATVAVFSGCGKGECCENGIAPTAVIDSSALADGTLSSAGSQDNNTGGSIQSYLWRVNGTEVEAGYTLPVGTHEVCLTVTDNDNLTNTTCQSVTIDAVANNAPLATVTAPDGVTCNAGGTITLNGSGTDTEDGAVAVSTYVWNPTTNITGSGASVTYTCPTSGSQKVCLTVSDSDGASSVETASSCKTITVTDPILKRPTAIIAEDTTQGDNGCDLTAGAPYIDNKAKYLSCGTSHDNDNIDPNPDKGRTDTSIVKCVWNVSVYINGVANPHAETYVTFLTDGGVDIANSTPGTHDPKWMGHEGDYKIITLTVFDDDDQNDTVTKKLDYSIGACGGLVDP